MKKIENMTIYRGHSLQFKKEAAEFYDKNGAGATILRYRISEETARRWHAMLGYKRKKVGAPKGNLNMLGGRITNTKRVADIRPLHKNG